MEDLIEDNRTCRICLRRRETVYSVFSKHKGKPLSDGLRRLGVNITIPGPKLICYECLTEVHAALNFLDKCEKSNQKLAEQSIVGVGKENTKVQNVEILNLEPFVVGHHTKYDNKTECDFTEEAHAATEITEEKCSASPIYTCSTCHKVFNRKFNFKRHLQRHSGDYDWACPMCGMRVISRWLALRHCEPRPRRPCPVPGCNKSYTSQSNLTTHIRMHNDERPFECAECGKKFTSKNTLNDHIRIHTGVKPYMCPVCGKRFTTNKLSAHMLSHGAGGRERGRGRERERGRAAALSGARLSCALCGATYNHKQSLNKHVKKQHRPLKPGLVDADPKKLPKETDDSTKAISD